MIVYGLQETLLDLDDRRADLDGNMHHVMAVTHQMEMLEDETSAEERKLDAKGPTKTAP